MRVVRTLGWLLAALSVGLICVKLGVLLSDPAAPGVVAGLREPEPKVSDAVVEIVMVAVFAGIGAFVVSRRPPHPIGWMLITIGLAFAVLFLAERLGWHFLVTDGRASTRAALFLWIADWFWIGAVVPLFIVIPLLFPTGRPLSPGWRRFMVIVLADVALVVASTTLARGPLDNYPTIQNPFGVT